MLSALTKVMAGLGAPGRGNRRCWSARPLPDVVSLRGLGGDLLAQFAFGAQGIGGHTQGCSLLAPHEWEVFGTPGVNLPGERGGGFAAGHCSIVASSRGAGAILYPTLPWKLTWQAMRAPLVPGPPRWQTKRQLPHRWPPWAMADAPIASARTRFVLATATPPCESVLECVVPGMEATPARRPRRQTSEAVRGSTPHCREGALPGCSPSGFAARPSRQRAGLPLGHAQGPGFAAPAAGTGARSCAVFGRPRRSS